MQRNFAPARHRARTCRQEHRLGRRVCGRCDSIGRSSSDRGAFRAHPPFLRVCSLLRKGRPGQSLSFTCERVRVRASTQRAAWPSVCIHSAHLPSRRGFEVELALRRHIALAWRWAAASHGSTGVRADTDRPGRPSPHSLTAKGISRQTHLAEGEMKKRKGRDQQ